MKRKILAILAVIACIALAVVSLTACKASVKGKTYQYDTLELIWSADATEADKEGEAEAKASLEEEVKNTVITFNKDDNKGSIKNGEEEAAIEFTYEETDDHTVILTVEDAEKERTLKLENNKLVIEYDVSDLCTVRIYLKVSK